MPSQRRSTRLSPGSSARRAPFLCLLALLAAAVAAACGGGGGEGEAILLVPEGNRLLALSARDPGRRQVLIPSAADAPGVGRDVNGQICSLPGTRRFVAGEDTGQPTPPPGFGVFELEGDEIGSLGWRQVGRLVPTYQGEPGPAGVPPTADPYGCAFLPDGRLLTTDIGNSAAGPPTGQLVIWFPPLDAERPRSCKIDVAIGTAQSVVVDDRGRAYVASARATAGVWRYLPPFPSSDEASGGCGRRDATGAPLADRVSKELVVRADANVPTPTGLALTRQGTLLVASVLNGVIAEYETDGRFLRRLLEPPAGEGLGPEPLSTGSPLGIALAPDGALLYADLGLVARGGEIGPGPRTGTLRRIRFQGDEPQPPETLASGLDFPDGVGVLLR